MKIVIINGSARKGNTLTAINAILTYALSLSLYAPIGFPHIINDILS